jgi:2-polyprenyl-6-methoxyphenol hydroxylase-like FAD-dependent oxidoreductase
MWFVHRADLLAILLRKAIRVGVDVKRGDGLVKVSETQEGVEVSMKSARTARFDLVIGADGMQLQP